MDEPSNSSSDIENFENADEVDMHSSSWESSPNSSASEQRNILRSKKLKKIYRPSTGKESPEWQSLSDADNDDHEIEHPTVNEHTGECSRTSVYCQNMEVEYNIAEIDNQAEEYQSDEFVPTWTNEFKNHLKSIVENHTLEEDDLEEQESNRRNIDNITAELGNIEFEFLDESDPEEGEEEENENSDDGGFEKLHKFLEKEDIFQRIDVDVKVSIGELLLLLVKYALIHSLGLSAVCNLFMLINCIFARPILPDSRYLIDKLFNPLNTVTFHALCPECGIDIGIFKSKDLQKHCSLCNINVNVKDPEYKNFFVTLDPTSRIKELLEANSEYYNDVMNVQQTDEFMRDIYDGKNYRRFKKSLDPADKNRFVSVTFNTDGAPLFESSAYSIWPIYIMLNELPFSVRTSELIVVGLWFGRSKPNMNIFLKPFVEDMNKLSTEGLKCNINTEGYLTKIFCLICCVDSIARAPLQGLMQFNGYYGCNWCLHPGKWVAKESKPNSGSHKYPLFDTTAANRNEKDSKKHMIEGSEEKPCFGFKNVSRLINLNSFNIIDGFVPDYMHIISGIGKQFANLWFGTNKVSSSFVNEKTVDDINGILKSIKAPHQVGRLTRSLKDKAFWKAREWENWVLYYSTPILKLFFDQKYVLHWVKLVEALYILLQSKITIDELNHADILLHEFVVGTEELYSQFAMTFNVHLLLHLSKSVLDWGPLFAHSAFAFESGNCQLLKSVHAAKGVHHQICRSINLNSSYNLLLKLIYPRAQVDVQSLCTQLGTSMIKNTIKVNSLRYFGKSSNVNSMWREKLNLSERARCYKKLVKDGCLYLSSIKKNERSDNTIGKLVDEKYIKIVEFIVDPISKQEFIICQFLSTQSAFTNNYKALQKVLAVSSDEIAMPTVNLEKVCVHLGIRKKNYVCAVPNLYSY
ncbi:uncharacterized protein LOC127291262 [Leptopilina boulardi]|uniref:uncharacterized protein LOC127278030 n=1 Tax=Leptopilina boulardi TaxID=63433 RepID=UPI0021F59BD0|nr:uncharacterized protein LOC127278030 [Leptopilina boulardi]XP_051169990.1 uncharacterized protein LOC127287210 [Leptopilina boulardi]XP_051176251.1 uncharacterized protein LOC127291262 [Leptopilina boulardi]